MPDRGSADRLLGCESHFESYSKVSYAFEAFGGLTTAERARRQACLHTIREALLIELKQIRRRGLEPRRKASIDASG